MMDIDEKLRKRILAFYFAGVVNLILGIYVLVEGPRFMGQGTATLVALFFLGFALVDFYFPRLMKKKWTEYQEQMRRQSGAAQPPKQ
ncbi:MAG: hypothetical protein HY526_11405 [Betaproteobacteria bacterium]|nr:hypothetical protein [Betaproteobacteria bacterium]